VQATDEAIKKKYRELAKKFHPDAGLDADEGTFKKICRAYEVLKNPALKSLHDQQLFYTGQFQKIKNTPRQGGHFLVLQLREVVQLMDTINTSTMDKNLLFQYLRSLLTDHSLRLSTIEEREAMGQLLMQILPFLGYRHWQDFKAHTLPFFSENATFMQFWNSRLKRKKQAYLIEKYKPLGILFIAVLICLFIWWAAKI